MPLSGDPKKDIPKLIHEGKPEDQAVAIAMSEERRKEGEPVKKIGIDLKPDEPEMKKCDGFYKSASL